jgi:two-component system response regulator MprA
VPEQILIIEDDVGIANMLRRGLIFEGYDAQVAHSGLEGLERARERLPDLVVLDVMLPGLDGLEVCRRLRAASQVPILMLTAREAVPDRVLGLDAGADDYMAKPFAFEELLARVRALLRRHRSPDGPAVLHFADLELDTGTRQARRGERIFDLTAKEYDLLHLFMRHPRQVLTRDQIFEDVWDYDFGGESNIIEVYVRYLRTKLEADGEPRLLHTVRGVGYAMREPN